MYENGNKVGIMGGEGDTLAWASATQQLIDWPEPTDEIIHQTISETPERNSTPLNDLYARILP